MSSAFRLEAPPSLEERRPAHTPVLLYRDGREAEVRLPSSPEPHLSRIVDRKLLEVIP